MPPKKKGACPSVNPQLYEKSMKPSMTMAMGMKCSHVAASCWRAQVEAEQRIHSNWSAKYDRTEEMRRVDALENTLQREIDKRETYRAHNDALQTIVYRKDGADPGSAAKTYLDARKALAPQDKYPQPPTSALEVGWSVPAAMRNDEHFASSPAAADIRAGGGLVCASSDAER
ncbi:hypothetical protein DQ04_06561010 [Trypanosoma grayi]|uniref:hypothetical protein n=1 Tax=Trypanosoma grayi TaxID=71804 RepID=UPI0004F4A644|nr:hypothetical protein DQ04_06561010 [Trypanosoma grayi]KEG08726.1 hypothetical protein DQ04_06561010 [Trypanosoma grayi]